MSKSIIKNTSRVIIIMFILLMTSFSKSISADEDGYMLQDIYVKDDNKIVFLTFDDGPSKTTDKILDILKEKDIKATFFILGVQAEQYPEALMRIYEEGHSIGNHTYSHLDKIQYCTPDKFVKDLDKNKELINDILERDINLNLVRFPYGSNSAKYQNKKMYIEKLREHNLKSIDWNVDARDSIVKNPSESFIMNKILEESKNKTRIVLLMHDSVLCKNTVKVLPRVIEHFKNKGFIFEKIASEQE